MIACILNSMFSFESGIFLKLVFVLNTIWYTSSVFMGASLLRSLLTCYTLSIHVCLLVSPMDWNLKRCVPPLEILSQPCATQRLDMFEKCQNTSTLDNNNTADDRKLLQPTSQPIAVKAAVSSWWLRYQTGTGGGRHHVSGPL